MKKLLKKLIITCLFTVISVSCSKDELSENEIVQDGDSVLKAISDWGFSKDEIEDKGKYYIVDGDIIFYKDKKYLSPSTNDSKQRMHPNSVTINTVNVFINPGMDINWRNASRDAINRWNAVSNSSLRLNITTSLSNAHIEIIYDTQDPNVALAQNVFGMGEFPSANGLPGTRIWVNPDFNSNLFCNRAMTQNMRISNVQHELGHNLGITHTNQNFGNLIPGTPTTDNGSVMNGGQACTINNFSSGDITAIEYLFPWVGLPKAYTRNPDPTICTNVFVQSDPYMLPVSPGAETYELTSNSPDLYVDRFVSPGQEITMITSKTGNYQVRLKTTNSYGSSYATIYVSAVSCNGGSGF